METKVTREELEEYYKDSIKEDANEEDIEDADIDVEDESEDTDEILTPDEAYDKYLNNEISYEKYYDICEDNDLGVGDIEYPDEEDSDIDIRALMLAKYFRVGYYDVDDLDGGEYSIYGVEGTWLVLTGDEAEEEAKNIVNDGIYNVGIAEYMGDDIDDYLDTDELYDWIYEDIKERYYTYSDGEIVKMAVDMGLYEEEDIYEVDEEESIEQRQLIYSDTVREDVDISDVVQELVEYEMDGIDCVEYMEDRFGKDWITDLNLEHFVDLDRYIDDCISSSGTGDIISSYDGRELHLGSADYDWYYAYRME